MTKALVDLDDAAHNRALELSGEPTVGLPVMLVNNSVVPRLRDPVVLVHYDRDFDHVAEVEPRFRAQWIVPPGSVA